MHNGKQPLVGKVAEEHDRNCDTILSTIAQGLLLKATYSSGSLGAACACVSLLTKMMMMMMMMIMMMLMMRVMMKLDDDGDDEEMYPPTHP